MPATATGAPKAQRDCADETRLGCRTPKRAVYRRRRSERTLLYCTVQNHLATWLALHDDGTGCCVPGVTEREFRRHLECGILGSVLCTSTLCRLRPRLPGRVFLQRTWRQSVLHYPPYGRSCHLFRPSRHSAPAGTAKGALGAQGLRYHGSEGEGVTFPHPYPCVST
jgi:hypothetical protein